MSLLGRRITSTPRSIRRGDRRGVRQIYKPRGPYGTSAVRRLRCEPLEERALLSAAPLVTSPALPVSVDADSYLICGTAEAGSLVTVSVDANNNGQVDSGEPAAGQQELSPFDGDGKLITSFGGSSSSWASSVAVGPDGRIAVVGQANTLRGWGFAVASLGNDSVAPHVTGLSPANNATGVERGTDLVITFSEDVQKGTTGNVVIRRSSDNAAVETIAVASSQVTVSGNQATIELAADLAESTGYYVQIDRGAFSDPWENA
jgi:hypothetical protein